MPYNHSNFLHIPQMQDPKIFLHYHSPMALFLSSHFSQQLAGFIDKFTYNVTPKPKVEAPKEQDQLKALVRWKLYIDGSSNQHDCGVRLILQTPLRK